jgi:DNA ligase (NAD+)
MKNKKFEDLANLDGIGETQIKSIKSFFSNKTNEKIINELTKILTIKDVIEASSDGIFKNKTFMFTGKLLNISRSEAKSLIEQNSGSIVSNVSKKLDYLIIGDKPTKRKVDFAKNLNIKILDQNSWLKMLK